MTIRGNIPANRIVAGWAGIGLLLLAMTATLAWASPMFGYAYDVNDMPVFWLAGGLVAAGLAWFALLPLLRKSGSLPSHHAKYLLWVMLAAGLAMRLMLFASEPVLEDDYQRYLWDGAVTANGLNPYGYSPGQAKVADPQFFAIGKIALESGKTLARVNHPHLKTVYPPLAQAAFALAYKLSPFSLTSWRTLILLCDLAALGLILALLRELGRSPLWSTLYWWNPLALKELFNSVHMEALLVPLLLASLLLAIRKRPLAATTGLLLAAGVKLWPALLLPLLWRELAARPRQLVLAAGVATLAGLLIAWPILAAGFEHGSGFVAYAGRWKTNSALFPLLESMAGPLGGRALCAIAVLSVLFWQSTRSTKNPQARVEQWLIVVASLFLLFPAQFPWYYLWVLPLLCLRPAMGLLILTVSLPLYYVAFHYLARDSYEVFTQGIVWLIWLPAWGLLAWEFRDRLMSLLPSQVRRTA